MQLVYPEISGFYYGIGIYKYIMTALTWASFFYVQATILSDFQGLIC